MHFWFTVTPSDGISNLMHRNFLSILIQELLPPHLYWCYAGMFEVNYVN